MVSNHGSSPGWNNRDDDRDNGQATHVIFPLLDHHHRYKWMRAIAVCPSSGANVKERAAGCAVFDPAAVTTYSELTTRIRELGALIHASARAELLIHEWDVRAQIIASRASGLRAHVVMSPETQIDRRSRAVAAVGMAALTIQDPADQADMAVGFLSLTEAHARAAVVLPDGMLADQWGGDLLDAATRIRVAMLDAGLP